jgi:probable phosphoglycerate mutase
VEERPAAKEEGAREAKAGRAAAELTASAAGGQLFLLVRHAHSVLNERRVVNGDPSVHVPLTPVGEEEARRLGEQLEHVPIDLCVYTRFDRTRRTAELALADRDVPFEVEPLLDDVDVGELEGQSIDDYRAWKRTRTRKDRFPGGESLDEAALRYAQGFRRLLEHQQPVVLVVAHEIPIRYALNGAAGSGELDGPTHELANATPYLFSAEALARGVERIEAIARRPA